MPASIQASISEKSSSTSTSDGTLLQHPPVGVDEPDVAAAGDAEVRVARLARPVDGATEHRHLERLGITVEPFLDLCGERLDADVVAAARRAGDENRPALPQAERLEDLRTQP